MLIVLDSCLTEASRIETMEIVSISVVTQITEFNSLSSKELDTFNNVNVKSRPFRWSNSNRKFSFKFENTLTRASSVFKRFHL